MNRFHTQHYLKRTLLASWLLVCFLIVPGSCRIYKADISNIDSLRSQIESDFEVLSKKLNQRKNKLLDELDQIGDTLLKEQKDTDNMIQDLESGFEYSRNTYETSEFLISINEQNLKYTTETLKQLKYHRTKTMILYESDNDMFPDLSKLGKIELREKVWYHNKIAPVIQTSKRGSKNGEIKPSDITIDTGTNNIFVADWFNNRIQVFDSNGKYLYKFGENGPGKMEDPLYIAIYKETVYVSLRKQHVNVYDVKGNYISQFGNTGVESQIISYPLGLAISHINGDIYVCDHDKDIIFVYSKDLKYKTSFGNDKLFGPLDIALTQDRIYVLDYSDPSIHIFNIDHSYSHSIVSRGSAGQAVGMSYSFALDIEDNILISDIDENLISVYTHEGDLIHQIGTESSMFYNPTGITIDRMNRIIIVDDKDEGCLMIF